MNARWEYLLVEWVYERRKKTRPVKTEKLYSSDPDSTEEYEYQEQYIKLTWPDGKVDPRGLWSTDHSEVSTVSKIFNELGADGWELVSDSTRSAKVYTDINGWPDASAPVEVAYWFKRQSSSTG
jgi:hypothetical protein